MKNILELINNISNKLNKKYNNYELAQDHAWWLVEEVTKKNKTNLIFKENLGIKKEDLEKLDSCINKIINTDIPIQYLIGYVIFNNLKILVKEPILIPRPETEEWVANLIKTLERPHPSTSSGRALKYSAHPEPVEGYECLKILDLCTGTGCIALTLAHNFPDAQITAVDISEEAIKLAKENAKLNNIKNINFVISDLYENINSSEKFDLIVANPPYISEKEWLNLDASVKNWEDKDALVAEKNGLLIIERILKYAKKYLKQTIAIEIGSQQGSDVKKLFEKFGFKNINIQKDMAGKDRVVIGNCE